ncbi:MAG: UvrD-helicase domain-containing protein, partial [Clostridia bacterium]|nr:UvrD-helicase domain-containing protein [Clostridia bacterium]
MKSNEINEENIKNSETEIEFNIENLNETQIEALNQTQGAVLVTAGAGSGKTRILTHRIVHLIKNLNVAPENILAITFTNKATNEMRERIEIMLPQIGGRVWVSTFHSTCARILRSNIHMLDNNFDSNFSIYAENETAKVINQILTERKIDRDDKFKKSVFFHISNLKNTNLTPEEYENENSYVNDIDLIMSIYKSYQKRLIENNAVDFDDLIILTYKLFKIFPNVLEKYSTRFKYILVDEFQDTNQIQYELVKCLAQTHKNIFVVGDEDQCIYTWRGANFKNIFKFKEDFENVKVFKLEQNYRSTKTILDYANRLIKNNKSRIDKKLWSNIESTDTTVERNGFYDEQGEAEFVARRIHNLVNEHGYKYKDFAILMRLNALSFNFEEKLLIYNIPHKIFGGFKFYERIEIKNILSYLKLFVNQKDEQAFVRVINFPKRGIGESTISKIKDEAQKNNISSLEVCLNAGNYDLPLSTINKLGTFSTVYKKLYDEFEHTPLDEFVINVINEFDIK